MQVPRHHAHHEQAEALPLVTCPATVTDVRALDENRSDEVMAAARDLLDWHGHDELVTDAGFDTDDPDWRRAWDEICAGAYHATLERKLTTLEERYLRAYPALAALRLDPEEAFAFAPGEYVTVHYRHVPRPYSIASSPNDDEIEICVRRVAGGKLSTQLCDDAAPGEEIVVRGPYGAEFTLRESSSRDIAFLATGTGVAPFKSMIDYAFEEGYDEHQGEKRDVWLFLGASWRDDLPYREAFRDLAAERDNFHFVPTLSRERLLSDWEGETAYVQQTLMKYLDPEAVDADAVSGHLRQYLGGEPRTGVDARIDPGDLDVYACGLNAMVYALVEAVTSVGVPEERVKGEGFG